MKKVILNNEHIEKLKSYLKEDKDEVTFYQFSSQLKNFLRELLSHPSNPQLSDFWKMHGFTKNKLIEYLLKIGMIEKDEKLNEEIPEEVRMDISYKIPKKDFERKQKKTFIKFFEKNLPMKQENHIVVNDFNLDKIKDEVKPPLAESYGSTLQIGALSGLPGLSKDDMKLMLNSPLTMGVTADANNEDVGLERSNLVDKINDMIKNHEKESLFSETENNPDIPIKSLKYATNNVQPKCNLKKFPKIWEEWASKMRFFPSKEEAMANKNPNDYVLYISNFDGTYNSLEHFESKIARKERIEKELNNVKEELMDEDGMAGGGATTTSNVGTDAKNPIATPLFGVISKDIYKPKFKN